MRFGLLHTLTTALSLVSPSHAARILMGNDDGFGSGNLREFYRLLKEAGHDVIIVAPVINQSAQGGRSDFTTAANLTAPGQYNIVPAGAPSVGPDPNDSHIWYYNGTPAACTFVALDYVLPRYFPDWNQSPDLFVSGPNFGVNLGPIVFTLTGTLGATYAAVSRSIPGIAFSASNDAIAYTNVTNSSNPATWAASVSVNIVEAFLNGTSEGQSVLPLGYGVNVNIPPLTSDAMPEVVRSRLTGEADTDIAVFNETTKLFKYGNVVPKAAGVNACINGDCNLPGETWVVQGGSISVSIFTIDYDAPDVAYTNSVFAKIDGLTGGGDEGNSSTTYKKRVVGKNGVIPEKLLSGRDNIAR
ncbi:sure-like protein [Periconia macrospinosa]|uniref:Sure-like protein n=1 Tax=Periconia macrospinosa TaxID=97972 RepID=A0A2V1D597_9PLEO|nr:sure-like protein [Periconia macrospinosa]